MNFEMSNIEQWMPLISVAAGAFLGALFAFWVSQLNERTKRIRKRWVKHLNGLVELEYKLNENLGLIADSRFQALNIIKSQTIKQGKVPLIWSQPQLLPRDTTLSQSLLRTKMINLLFSYNEKIRKLNDDTRNMCTAYEEMRSARLRNDVSTDQYNTSYEEYRTELPHLVKAYDLMDERTETLLAHVRAALSEDDRRKKIFLFGMPTLSIITETDVQNERSRLLNEIKETQERSRKEIDDHLC